MTKPVLGWWFGDVLGYGREAEAGMIITVTRRCIIFLPCGDAMKVWNGQQVETYLIAKYDEPVSHAKRTIKSLRDSYAKYFDNIDDPDEYVRDMRAD